jgi:hypothetical protein
MIEYGILERDGESVYWVVVNLNGLTEVSLTYGRNKF